MRCRIHTFPVAALTAALIASSSASFAQEPTEFEPSRLAGWTFTPGMIASTVFDDNVGLATDLPNTPNPQGDQMFVIQPSGQLEYIGPRTTFDSGYRGYLRRYSDFNELNGYDHRGYASVRYLATRHLMVFLNNTFIKAPSTDELQLNGVPFSRTGSRNDRLAAGFESRLTRQLDLNIRYDLSWVDFDQSEALLRSGLFHGVRTEVARRLNDRTAVGAEYAVRVANLDEGTRNLTFQNAGVTFRYDTGPRTSVHAAGGLAYLLDRSLDESHTGPYVRADITHHLERATLGASFGREFVPTFGFGGSSQSESFHAYVTMPVTHKRIYLQQSVSWQRSDPLIVTSPALDSWWLHSTVGYGLSRLLRLEGFYAYSRQDTRLAGGLVNRNRIGAQIAISQPMRIQ